MENSISNDVNKFCLVMIVRDEEPIVERCLESVSNIATSYVICDTGSKDNTIKVIQDYMFKKGIPGEIITHEWKNFGYNKSYLLEKAQKDNLCKNAKYLFWLDADEVYLTDPENPLSYPTKKDADNLFNFLEENKESSIFHIRTLFGSLRYWRWNIVRNDRKYMWLAPVHEYLVSEPATGTVNIESIWLLARKEGNSARNPDRYIKDAEMFEEYIKERGIEECPREVFYLAQTYESVPNSEHLVKKYYDLRISLLNGYYQERYIAALRMARRSNGFEKVTYLLKGIEICPHRLEVYYELMKHYENTNKDLAYRYGLMAFTMDAGLIIERQDDLFVEREIYDWHFDLDFSLNASYSNHHKEAYLAGQKLLSRGQTAYSKYLYDLFKTNQTFYNQRYTPPLMEDQIRIINVTPNESNSLVNGTLKWEISQHRNLIIIDNFFKDPDSVREFALIQEYPVFGNYPGKRTKSFATEDMKNILSQIVGRPIKYWPSGYNGSFQYTTGDMQSWIHRDLTDYGGVLFLTPNPPDNTGTTFYKHKVLQLEECEDPALCSIMDNDSRNYDNWIVVDAVANKYNRLILFNGRRSHSSTSYFGDSLTTGRLFQTFFFSL